MCGATSDVRYGPQADTGCARAGERESRIDAPITIKDTQEDHVRLLALGVIVLLIGAALFWRCLPRSGKMHRFVGTGFEPYVAVAFCAATALSLTLIFSGVIDLVEGR